MKSTWFLSKISSRSSTHAILFMVAAIPLLILAFYMAYETLRIACSPLTGKFYAGRLHKDGNRWSGDKKDVTSDVKIAVVNHLRDHCDGSEIFTIDDGKSYFEISIKPVTIPEKTDGNHASG